MRNKAKAAKGLVKGGNATEGSLNKVKMAFRLRYVSRLLPRSLQQVLFLVQFVERSPDFRACSDH